MRVMCLSGLLLGSAAVAAAEDVDLCGKLVQGTTCVLFESGTKRYLLSDPNFGGFAVGDALRVRGELDPNCVTVCLQGAGCIDVDEISYCDGEVEICGQLVQGAECVLLRDSEGRQFALDDVGRFDVGDRVIARGFLLGNCVSICQAGEGCLTNVELEATISCNPDDDPSFICSSIASGIGLFSLALLFAGSRSGARAPSR